MKKYFLLLMASACISVADAQLIKQNEEQKKQADLDWYNCSFDQDGVYGAEVNKAYEFLKEKKIGNYISDYTSNYLYIKSTQMYHIFYKYLYLCV